MRTPPILVHESRAATPAAMTMVMTPPAMGMMFKRPMRKPRRRKYRTWRMPKTMVLEMPRMSIRRP